MTHAAVFFNAMILREPYSGVEVTVHQTLRALAEHGTMPLCACLPASHRPIPPTPLMRLMPIKFAGNSKLLRIIWEQTALPVLLRRWRVPLLHAPAYVAPLLAQCPCVLTVHDLHVFTHPAFCSAGNRLHYRMLMPRSIQRAARIIAYSEHTRDNIIASFPEAASKITVVPPGIQSDLQPCSDPARLQTVKARYGLAEKFLLFVGDLTSRKNIDGIIRAFAALHSKHPGLHLTLAGHCDRRMSSILAAAAAETGVAGQLTLPGYIAPEDLAAVYSLAALLVFPSHDEGFGLPPLEAMACGCPVVCSRGPLSAMHGPAATACDAAVPASIAEACHRLLEDSPYREAQIRAGFQRSAAFSWKTSAAALQTVYRELLHASE
ncbi:MAG: glycosyltransferase family 1 protein [Kiritimatiellae bacterium]|nr:glycosyltransferase family 1 protein [Kiritimatiellia bacterium]